MNKKLVNVFVVLWMKIEGLWDVTSCNLVSSDVLEECNAQFSQSGNQESHIFLKLS
jgi:hypothetical protein